MPEDIEIFLSNRPSEETPRGFVRAMKGDRTLWFGPITNFELEGYPLCVAGTELTWHPLDFIEFKRLLKEVTPIGVLPE